MRRSTVLVLCMNRSSPIAFLWCDSLLDAAPWIWKTCTHLRGGGLGGLGEAHLFERLAVRLRGVRLQQHNVRLNISPHPVNIWPRFREHVAPSSEHVGRVQGTVGRVQGTCGMVQGTCEWFGEHAVPSREHVTPSGEHLGRI